MISQTLLPLYDFNDVDHLPGAEDHSPVHGGDQAGGEQHHQGEQQHPQHVKNTGTNNTLCISIK